MSSSLQSRADSTARHFHAHTPDSARAGGTCRPGSSRGALRGLMQAGPRLCRRRPVPQGAAPHCPPDYETPALLSLVVSQTPQVFAEFVTSSPPEVPTRCATHGHVGRLQAGSGLSRAEVTLAPTAKSLGRPVRSPGGLAAGAATVRLGALACERVHPARASEPERHSCGCVCTRMLEHTCTLNPQEGDDM